MAATRWHFLLAIPFNACCMPGQTRCGSQSITTSLKGLANNGLGANLIYMSYFASLLHPQEEKLGYYFQLGTCLGALETHVLLSFLWSAFCKWPVINVTPLTLKIVVLKIQDY